MKIFLSLPFFWILGTAIAAGQQASEIRLNQLGYYSRCPKVALVADAGTAKFFLRDTRDGKVAYTGTLNQQELSGGSRQGMSLADFSSFTRPGRYELSIPETGTSYPFSIGAGVYKELASASVKAFYYQRVSEPLSASHAGKWARAAGHPDTSVLIHPSAASEGRAAGSRIFSPGGWYDAGDYNKYIVNSGITMGTLLSLCEDFPDYVSGLDLNIPESNNRVPDILDEVLCNLRWMLTMQDPSDGGVYHKLTNAEFDGMVMPGITKADRYVVQKGTAATLDFAAVTAQAARVLRKYGKELPGLSDSCLKASVRAWGWARTKPALLYDQERNNTLYKPAVNTGGYGDRDLSDEWIWAAAELAVTTGDDAYCRAVNFFPDEKMPLPSWGNVRLLAYYTLLRSRAKLSPAIQVRIPDLKVRLLKFADQLLAAARTSPFKTPMGGTDHDFIWGSNAVAANQGIALIQAYLGTGAKKYLDAAAANLDYLLGRNGTGYSFITGYGSKTPMHPHHRPSAADGVEEPVPGLLVGGPNPGQQDRVPLPSAIPSEAYADDERSYATNEIAINWNAPLAYLVNALEALQYRSGYSPAGKQAF